MSRPPAKVLVVALDNLGDTVMASALLAPLRHFLPQAEVGFWVKSYSAEVLAGQRIDHVHAADPFWDSSPGRAKGSAAGFARALGEVRAQGYELALVLNTEWRRALACRLAGIPRRIGYGARKSRLFLTQALSAAPGGHQIDAHRRLLEAALGLSVPRELCRPRLELSEQDRRAGQDWLARRGWSDCEVLMLHPFTGDPLKCWPLASWGLLIARLGERRPRARFALACGPGEAASLEPVLAGCRGIAAAVSLAEMRGLLSAARAFAGGDSGPGHLAAAADVPTLSLFGPTSPERYAPSGRGRVIVLRQDPLAGLPVERVAEALEALL
jgi:ADP-heptose:LPS heptosyltransferase